MSLIKHEKKNPSEQLKPFGTKFRFGAESYHCQNKVDFDIDCVEGFLACLTSIIVSFGVAKPFPIKAISSWFSGEHSIIPLKS